MLGIAVGLLVGALLGAKVGGSVGVCVGANEGLSVVGGSVVGTSVGLLLGAALGRGSLGRPTGPTALAACHWLAKPASQPWRERNEVPGARTDPPQRSHARMSRMDQRFITQK